MSFEEAVAQQPQWVQIWVNVMGVVIVGAFVVFLFSRRTWKDAAFVLLANVGAFLLMNWLYTRYGYVRLIGFGHVPFWTPLAIYLWFRLKNPDIGRPFRVAMWVLLATLAVSLAFDYTDTIRYIAGERAPLTRPA